MTDVALPIDNAELVEGSSWARGPDENLIKCIPLQTNE